MTDIRKHGFESDAQWREYLAEIEEVTSPSRRPPGEDATMLRDLAGLRADVAVLRRQVAARASRRGPSRPWRMLGAAAFLLLLAAAGR